MNCGFIAVATIFRVLECRQVFPAKRPQEQCQRHVRLRRSATADHAHLAFVQAGLRRTKPPCRSAGVLKPSPGAAAIRGAASVLAALEHGIWANAENSGGRYGIL